MDFFVVLHKHLVKNLLVFLGHNRLYNVFKIDFDVIKNLPLLKISQDFYCRFFEDANVFRVSSCEVNRDRKGRVCALLQRLEIVQVPFFWLVFLRIDAKYLVDCCDVGQSLLVDDLNLLQHFALERSGFVHVLIQDLAYLVFPLHSLRLSLLCASKLVLEYFLDLHNILVDFFIGSLLLLFIDQVLEFLGGSLLISTQFLLKLFSLVSFLLQFVHGFLQSFLNLKVGFLACFSMLHLKLVVFNLCILAFELLSHSLEFFLVDLEKVRVISVLIHNRLILHCLSSSSEPEC